MTLSSLVASKSFQEQRLAGKAAALSLLSRVAPEQGLHCAPCVEEKADVISEVCHMNNSDCQLDEEIVDSVGPIDVMLTPEAAALEGYLIESTLVEAASPEPISFALPAPAPFQSHKAAMTLWRFDAGDGVHRCPSQPRHQCCADR